MIEPSLQSTSPSYILLHLNHEPYERYKKFTVFVFLSLSSLDAHLDTYTWHLSPSLQSQQTRSIHLEIRWF